MLTACNSPPRGSSGGRIDTYSTTNPERRSQSANIASMLEFVDISAEDVVDQLSDIRAAQAQPGKMTLALGGIVNKTQHTPTVDFEMIQDRLRRTIQRSPFVRQHVRFIADPNQTDAELARLTGRPGNPAPLADRPDAASTYVLTGAFYEAVRGPRSQYMLTFEMINLQSSESVYTTKPFDLGQVRSP